MNPMMEFAPPPAMMLDMVAKGLVVLAVAIVAFRGMRSCSAAARHLVLFLAVISLLALPLLCRWLPGWHTLPHWMHLPAPLSGMRESGPSDAPPLHASPAILETATQTAPSAPPADAVGKLATLVASASATHGKEPGWTWWHWACAVWLTGFFCALLPVGLGFISLWCLERQSHPMDAGPPLESLRALSASLRFRRRVALLITAQRRMPMTWGLLWPKLLLPVESCDWSEERRRVVLLHELAHIQRWDYLTNFLTEFACALYWFNPLVWLAARQMRAEREQACDDLVLNEGARPSGYAEEILQIAAGLPAERFEAYGAIAMARPSCLEGRLLAILDGTRNRRVLTRSTVLTASLLLTLAIVPLSMLRGALDPAASSPAGAGSSRGLVAWWRAEGDGTDSSGAHGGHFPFGVRYAQGLVGQAFDFRRRDALEHLLHRVSVPDSPAFQLSESMTLEAWVFPRRYGGVILFRGDDRGGFDTWHLNLLREGHLSFSFNDPENKAAGLQTPIQLHQWQHVVATFDRGAMKLYINAVLVAQADTALRPIARLDAGADPAIGIGNVGGKRYNMPFDGLLDEVRIYSRALSDAEIAESLASAEYRTDRSSQFAVRGPEGKSSTVR